MAQNKNTCHNSRSTNAEALLRRNIRLAQEQLDKFLRAKDAYLESKRKFHETLDGVLVGARAADEDDDGDATQEPPAAPTTPAAATTRPLAALPPAVALAAPGWLCGRCSGDHPSDKCTVVDKPLTAEEVAAEAATTQAMLAALQPATTSEVTGAPEPLAIPDLRRLMSNGKDTEVWASGECTTGFIGDEDTRHAPRGTLVCGYGTEQADISDAHADWLAHAQLCHAQGLSGSVKLVQRATNGSQQTIAQWPARIVN